MKLLDKAFNIYKAFNFAIKSGLTHYGPLEILLAEVSSDLWMRVYANKALQYFEKIQPINNSVSRITREFYSIRPMFYDQNKKTYIEIEEIRDVLKKPNPTTSSIELLEDISNNYQLTGNFYLLLTGDFEKGKLYEIYSVSPAMVKIQKGTKGYIEYYEIRYQYNPMKFYRKETYDGRFRYFDKDGRELWSVKNYNPAINSNKYYGMSPLNPIYLELNQYEELNIHNLSMIKNQALPSGAFSVNAKDQAGKPIKLTDDQYRRLEAEVEKNYKGSKNTGRPMLLEGGLGWQQMSLSPKDMDYSQLRKDMKNTISEQLGIPLALIDNSASTYNNLETANLMLYLNAVLPLTNKIYSELTSCLMPRFKDKYKNVEIKYDASSILALEILRNNQLSLIKDIGILTINEMRTVINYEAIEGGDTLYQPMSMIPIGYDKYTRDQLQEPKKDINNITEKKTLKDKYFDILKKDINNITEKKTLKDKYFDILKGTESEEYAEKAWINTELELKGL